VSKSGIVPASSGKHKTRLSHQSRQITRQRYGYVMLFASCPQSFAFMPILRRS